VSVQSRACVCGVRDIQPYLCPLHFSKCSRQIYSSFKKKLQVKVVSKQVMFGIGFLAPWSIFLKSFDNTLARFFVILV